MACTLILIVCIMWNMCKEMRYLMYNMINRILNPLGQWFLKVHTSWWTFWLMDPETKVQIIKGPYMWSHKFGPLYKSNCVDLGFGLWTFNAMFIKGSWWYCTVYNYTDLYKIPCDQHSWGISLFPVSVSSWNMYCTKWTT